VRNDRTRGGTPYSHPEGGTDMKIEIRKVEPVKATMHDPIPS
jgi:hypothetical protein